MKLAVAKAQKAGARPSSRTDGGTRTGLYLAEVGDAVEFRSKLVTVDGTFGGPRHFKSMVPGLSRYASGMTRYSHVDAGAYAVLRERGERERPTSIWVDVVADCIRTTSRTPEHPVIAPSREHWESTLDDPMPAGEKGRLRKAGLLCARGFERPAEIIGSTAIPHVFHDFEGELFECFAEKIVVAGLTDVPVFSTELPWAGRDLRSLPGLLSAKLKPGANTACLAPFKERGIVAAFAAPLPLDPLPTYKLDALGRFLSFDREHARLAESTHAEATVDPEEPEYVYLTIDWGVGGRDVFRTTLPIDDLDRLAELAAAYIRSADTSHFVQRASRRFVAGGVLTVGVRMIPALNLRLDIEVLSRMVADVPFCDWPS